MASEDEILKQLINKKDEIESQIKLWIEVLNSQKGVGMDGPLVDSEQFPRSDIDIHSVRHARQQVICLKNDLKSLMKEIESQLYKLHERHRLERGTQESMDVDDSQESRQTMLVPFGRIDRVDAGSPAERAGLETGDEIVQFGSISSKNFEKLKQIGDLIQNMINKPISVTLLRNSKEKRVSLTPCTWSGRGLLGCIIVPVKK